MPRPLEVNLVPQEVRDSPRRRVHVKSPNPVYEVATEGNRYDPLDWLAVTPFGRQPAISYTAPTGAHLVHTRPSNSLRKPTCALSTVLR